MPWKASPYLPPRGLVADTTPPTRISVGVTPVSFTATWEPSGVPELAEVSCETLAGLLPQAAAIRTRATTPMASQPRAFRPVRLSPVASLTAAPLRT